VPLTDPEFDAILTDCTKLPRETSCGKKMKIIHQVLS